jgi:alanine-glyoxylate transaminase/(R)-3-amino-2-methylpropionate-pyruvate transaminase
VVTTPEIAEVLTRRQYFNTFGGNPVCTAAGLAVLRVIEKENLQKNALVVGSYVKERLNALKDKYESKIFIIYFCICILFIILSVVIC